MHFVSCKLRGSILALLLCPGLAVAAEPAAVLDTVTIVGKSEQPLAEVAATVSVITAQDMQRRLASDLRDLVLLEPGVSVGGDPSRFGPGSVVIRGLGGNRVLLETDGVPAPAAFAVGSYSNAGRHYGELELVRRVEILRGPASSLYGSDALAGVVATTTLDPADLLGARDRGALRFRAGYSGDDDSWFTGLTAAARAGTTDWMLAWGRRSSGAPDIASHTARPNPQSAGSDALLLRAVHHGAGRPLRLTAAWERGTQRTAVDSLEMSPGRFANTVHIAADDRDESLRLLLDQDLQDVGPLERLHWRLYWQLSETRQLTDEERRAVPPRTPPLAIERGFRFRERTAGAEVTAISTLAGKSGTHRLTAGAELAFARVDELRDGLQTDLASGTTSRLLLGEAMPVRDFPRSEIANAGVYVQDEFRPRGGRLALIPALRLDWHRLTPRSDAIYAEDNPAQLPVAIDTISASPKLGLTWRLRGGSTAFLQYSHGHRAPPFEDVNIGLDLPQFNVRAIPNPELKAERSDSIEAGWRLSGKRIAGTASVFVSRYRDFIESKVNLGPDPVTGTVLFQSLNLARAEIRGAEASLGAALAAMHPALAGWSAQLAVGFVRGTDTERDRPLNSVDPLRGSLALRYEDQAGRFAFGLTARGAAGKRRLDETQGALFRPPGFVALDLTASWTMSEALRIDAGVFNLTDTSYFEWSDVRGRAADDPLLEYYRRPGRHASVAATVRF